MMGILYKKATGMLESNKIPIFLFFSSMFIFLSFAGTRLFISDEAVILNQFYNLIHGSLSLELGKFKVMEGGVYFISDDHIYSKFSFSLPIFSVPVYYFLKTIDLLYGAHLFLVQLWAMSGGIAAYLIARNRKSKQAELFGVFSYFILIAVNMYYFKPIYFPMWGELLSIEFTNILISSFLVLFVYLLFNNFFGNKIAMFASFFVIFATPISFYAVSLKHHVLTLLLTVLAFYFFYRYEEKKENKFMYFAFLLAGLCVWTRVLEGAVLLTSLLIADILLHRRSIKHIIYIFIIISISLIPFFSFNYLILGNPVSIMETAQSTFPSSDEPLTMNPGKDAIILNYDPTDLKPDILLGKLGYSYNQYSGIKSDWWNILLNITFLKIQNAFGIFLVSPFLIIAIAFIIDRIKKRIKLSPMDKFLGLYTILFIYSNLNYISMTITDTPDVIEYRYLLIMYIILLYFALRIDKVKDLIESKLRTIVILYGIILLLSIVYFVEEFPLPFMNIYYYAALFTSLSLIVIVSTNILMNKKPAPALLNSMTIILIALSLALASMFLLFYYWVVSMTYTSPSQNFTILPVLQNILGWMYGSIMSSLSI